MTCRLNNQKQKKKPLRNTTKANLKKCENNAKTEKSNALSLSDMIDLIPRKDLQPR